MQIVSLICLVASLTALPLQPLSLATSTTDAQTQSNALAGGGGIGGSILQSILGGVLGGGGASGAGASTAGTGTGLDLNIDPSTIINFLINLFKNNN